MSDTKFKIGDVVWNYIQGRLATIVAYHEKQDMYELDNGFMADEDDLEPLDKEEMKNQFLNEMQCLLTKYNAYIVLRKHIGYKEKNVMDIVGHSLGLVLCNEIIGQWDSTITPSNIF